MESSTKNEHESEQQMLHSCPDNEKNSDNHDAIEEKLPNNQSNVDAERVERSEDVIDGNGKTALKNPFSKTKQMAEGMMDIALLTANANQLRFLLTYNSTSRTFYVSVALIVTSLIIQVSVGIALIFKSRIRENANRLKANSRTDDFLVGGVFIVTVINVFAAAFTTTDNDN